ncbi:Uncharacterized protein TCM_040753 [Theobroma cacao]|uniref:Uncharacterized protein n=1 Tax=Theobroma cacao TaxID=3641 RepID=A0A061GZB2_THECC|nr:Uncharacterized protein TCM_040753 [Theobroma cacao]
MTFESLYVREFTTPEGEWDMDRLTEVLPEDFVQQIASLLPPFGSHCPDVPEWAHSSLGCFTLSSTYDQLRTAAVLSNAVYDDGWNLVWKWQESQCICLFLF